MATSPGLELGYQAAQFVALLVAAPLMELFVQKVKARLMGRRGPPLFKGYSELFALLSKESILSEDASFLARLSPWVSFGAAVVAALLVPVFVPSALGAFWGDVLVLFGLFVLVRVVHALAALDMGSPLGGLFASRSVTLSLLTLPPLLLALIAVAVPAGTLALGPMMLRAAGGPETDFFAAYAPARLLQLYTPSQILALGAFFLVLLGETGRLSGPGEHSRLSRVAPEGAEYGGRALALFSYGRQLTQLIFFVLFANLFLPGGIAQSGKVLDLSLGAVALVLKVLLVGVMVAVVDVLLIRPRFFKLLEVFAVALGAAFLAALPSPYNQQAPGHSPLLLALLQIGNGLLLFGALSLSVQQRVRATRRLFVLLSWVVGLQFLLLALSQESWYGLALGLLFSLSAVGKAWLLPRLLRRREEGEKESGGALLTPSSSLLIALGLLTICLLLGRQLVLQHSLATRDTIAAGGALLLVGALMLGTRREPSLQLISLALLGEGVLLAGVASSPTFPLAGLLLDLLLFALLAGSLAWSVRAPRVEAPPAAAAIKEE